LVQFVESVERLDASALRAPQNSNSRKTAGAKGQLRWWGWKGVSRTDYQADIICIGNHCATLLPSTLQRNNKYGLSRQRNPHRKSSSSVLRLFSLALRAAQLHQSSSEVLCLFSSALRAAPLRQSSSSVLRLFSLALRAAQ
jgi:hypothetical protein